MALQPYDELTERPVQQVSTFDRGLARLVAHALADKSLLWISMLGGIGIWSFCLAHPDVMHIVAAGGYSVSVFIPVLFKKG